jgi:hypothetical protein
MTTPTSTYRFAPWARRGLADHIKGADTGAPLPARAQVGVGLTVTGSSRVTYDLSLYGPGDVLGVDTTLIVRTDPRPNATDVEANYVPAIEFDAPDFPWMFTPAVSGSNNRLRPWCVLIVVDLAAVDAPRTEPGRPLPVLTVPADVRALELPDLAESWAWAHVQAVERSGSMASSAVAASMTDDPSMSVARLLAPRRLEPGKRYAACLVPAFDAGVARGLSGVAPITGPLTPAWSDAAPGDVRLPVYYHWEFSTGPAGDFESLARRLKPAAPPESAGVESMYIGDAGPELAAIPPTDPAGYLDMDGPLRAPRRSNATLDDVPTDVRLALQRNLDAAADQLQSGSGQTASALGPPLYGGWYANQHTVPDKTPVWLRELNLDPRARAAAALGAEIERRNQDLFMQWAWAQVGEVLKANRLLSQARLSMEALDRVYARHVATLPPDRALQFSAPLHPRATMDGATVAAAIGQSSLPDAAGDPALRRLTSPRNRYMRAAALHAPVPHPPPAGQPVPPPPGSFVSQLAAGELPVDPTRYVPAGIMGCPELANNPQTIWGNVVFDLPEPITFLGLPSGMTNSQISSLQTQSTAATNAPIPETPGVPAPPPVPPLVPFALAPAKGALVARMNPRGAVVARVQSMLSAGGAPIAASPAVRMPLAGGSALATTGRSPLALAPTVDRILAAPELDVPVYRYLAALDPSRLMPGVGDLPADSIMLLETNPRFVEALLAGLNHEMNRELLWRGFPTDQRGTPFRQFWGWSDGGADIAPIDTWPADNALGANARGGSGQIVMLIRGRLLQRYPHTAIYAWRASGNALVRTPQPDDIRTPVFAGTLGADIAYVGFDLTDADLAEGDGWFFVLQDQPTAPRFGFDVGVGAAPATLKSWADASWDDVGAAPGQYLKIAGNPQSGVTLGSARFVDHAAHLAYITIQQPVCVALHARTITGAHTP